MVWTIKDQKDNTYVALFNIGEKQESVGVTLSQLGLKSEKRVKDI